MGNHVKGVKFDLVRWLTGKKTDLSFAVYGEKVALDGSRKSNYLYV